MRQLAPTNIQPNLYESQEKSDIFCESTKNQHETTNYTLYQLTGRSCKMCRYLIGNEKIREGKEGARKRKKFMREDEKEPV